MASMKPPGKGFDNGIKATRFWLHTGRQHLKEMLTSTRAFKYPQRSRYQMLLIYGIVVPSMVATAYSFGRIDVQKIKKQLIGPVPYCQDMGGKSKPKPKPCPKEEPEIPMCPCEIPEEEKHKECKEDKKRKKKKKIPCSD